MMALRRSALFIAIRRSSKNKSSGGANYTRLAACIKNNAARLTLFNSSFQYYYRLRVAGSVNFTIFATVLVKIGFLLRRIIQLEHYLPILPDPLMAGLLNYSCRIQLTYTSS